MNDEQTQTQEQQQKLLSNEMMEIYEKYVTPHTGDFELLSRSTPLMETGLFIGMIGLAYNPEIIVYCFKFIMLLNVLISGVTLASFIVGTFIYSKEDVEDTDGYESEVDEKYEDMYDIDEIEDISGNPSENVYISDVTPDGIAFMKYNNYKEGFEYWAEEKKRQEEQSEMEKEDLVKLDDVDDDDDVFAKLKTNVDKRYDETTRKKNKQDSVVDQANKYIYMGKINEMLAFKTTRNDELSDTATKKNVSFSMFKALGLK